MRRLAQDSYGRIPARGEAPARRRPQEPPPHAHRLVTLADPKVEQPSAQRVYLVPSYRTGGQEAMALEVLAHHLGGGQTSMLYRALVLEQRIAVAAGAYYMGTSLDDTRFYIWAMPVEGVTLETLEAAIDKVDRRRRQRRPPTRATSPGPRRGSSPTPSMPRTARRRWRAGTARPSPRG